MRELSFAKEPFDSKLFIICFMKKLGIVFVAMVIGAVLVGSANYLKKVVFGGPAQYEISSTYYIDYFTDPQTGAMNNYVNESTWESLIDTDWFTERIWYHALELGMIPDNYNVSQDDLPGFLSADLLTDVHMPGSMVVTENAELTKVLNEAVQMTFYDFADEQPEILGIKIMDETPLQEKDRDDRTVRACILGAVLGGFAACVGTSLWLIADDSVYVPETFSFRYGIPMLGTLGKNEAELPEAVKVNLQYVFRDKKTVALYCMDSEIKLPKCDWPEKFTELKANDLKETYEKLREAEAVLLLVKAGARNGKEIEHCLHEFTIQNIKVQGALLIQADNALLKWYRMGRK